MFSESTLQIVRTLIYISLQAFFRMISRWRHFLYCGGVLLKRYLKLHTRLTHSDHITYIYPIGHTFPGRPSQVASRHISFCNNRQTSCPVLRDGWMVAHHASERRYHRWQKARYPYIPLSFLFSCITFLFCFALGLGKRGKRHSWFGGFAGIDRIGKIPPTI